MKRYIVILPLLSIFCSLCLGLNSAFSVDFIQLEREFAGKGSSQGRFGKDIHLAFDNQNIYVSDTQNRLIQKLSATGEFLFQIPEAPESADNILRKPGHLAVDNMGNIYVADVTAHHIADSTDPKVYMFAPCIYKFSRTGELLDTYFVDPVDVHPKVILPANLIIDEEGKASFAIQPKGHDRALRVALNVQNELYVLDAELGHVHKFNAEGEKLITFGRYGAGEGEFDMDAADIAIDARGNVLIADTGNHRIVRFDAAGKPLDSFGREGRGNGEFMKPMALATLPTGEILVKDASQFRRKVGGLQRLSRFRLH